MSSLMQQVSKNLYCLNTFCSIYPAADIHQWFSFSRSNMLEEILDHLKKGSLDIAASIWHRHQYEFLTDINDDCVSRILNAIPYEISSTILCSWLPKHLLRDLIQLCPSSIETIAKWTDNRIKTLELVEKEAWPQNGHKLATVTIEAIEKISAEFYAGGNIEVQLAVHMVNWKAHSPSSCVYHLRQTALALKDLQFLAEKFYIKVKFSEYTQEDKSAVIYALLDWLVSGEEVEPLIKDFINPFVRRYELNLNEILESYVFNCLDLSHCSWWMHEEAPWEDKTYAVINVISDPKIKVRCIVECVRMAPVPWSEGTQKICNIGKSLNTLYVTDLQEQEHLAKLKIILRRYNLHLINYESVYNGRFILRSILNREGETVLKDALTVISALKNVNMIDAYYYRILYLLNSGSYNEVKDIFTKVDSEEESKLCVKLIRYFAEHCMSIPNMKCREKLKKLYGSLSVLEPFFKRNVRMAYTDLENVLEKFARIHQLQVKYDLYPTLNEIEDDEFCINYLKNFITDLYTKCQEQPKENQNLNRTSILSGTQKRQSLAVGNLESSRVSFLKSQKTSDIGLPISEIDSTSKSEESFSKHVNSVEYLSQLLGISRERLLTLHAFIANKKGYLSEALDYTRQMSEGVGCNFSLDIVHELIKSASNHQRDNINKKISPEKEVEEGVTKLVLECISLSLMYCNPSSVFVLNEYGFLYHLHNLLLEQCHFKGVYAHDRNVEPVQTLQNNPFSEIYWHCGMPLDEDIVSEKLKIVENRANFVHSNFSSAYFSTKGNVEIYGEPKPLRAVSDLVQHLYERSHDLLALFISQNICSNVRINNEIPSFDIRNK
ncbi:Kinetochore-associated protein 1 [Armadillidium vulgare]|nr:Kinetochore-associated protein 1 [Armadillidium vulgare]